MPVDRNCRKRRKRIDDERTYLTAYYKGADRPGYTLQNALRGIGLPIILCDIALITTLGKILLACIPVAHPVLASKILVEQSHRLCVKYPVNQHNKLRARRLPQIHQERVPAQLIQFLHPSAMEDRLSCTPQLFSRQPADDECGDLKCYKRH